MSHADVLGWRGGKGRLKKWEKPQRGRMGRERCFKSILRAGGCSGDPEGPEHPTAPWSLSIPIMGTSSCIPLLSGYLSQFPPLQTSPGSCSPHAACFGEEKMPKWAFHSSIMGEGIQIRLSTKACPVSTTDFPVFQAPVSLMTTNIYHFAC